MKIFIDPGHGGQDFGKINEKTGLKESDVNLDIALKFGKVLEDKGYNIYYSRKTDEFVFITDRVKLSNNSGSDILISIHCNYSKNKKIQGIETYCYRFGTKSEELAYCTQKNIINETMQEDRGIKTKNNAILKLSKMPAIIVNLGYISNLYEAQMFSDESFKIKYAVGIINGVNEFLQYADIVHRCN